MLEPPESPRITAAFTDGVAMSELPPREMPRVLGPRTAFAEPRFAQFEMKSHLLLELGGVPIAENEKAEASEEFEQRAHAMQRRRSTVIEPP